jgi:ribonuclease PH
MKRIDGRKYNQLRTNKIATDYLAHPLGSVLFESGGTKIISSVSVEQKVPPWMKAQKVNGGWVTCEYGMLPASTHERVKREASSGKQSGRTMEIQRLIGRSFRTVIDLDALGPNTIYIDCDVIDADGGTRCASITGACIALQIAFSSPAWRKQFGTISPMRENVAAVSVGIVDGEPVLDLCYEEDSNAEVDMNVIMTESGKFIEVQGTAERQAFSRGQLDELLNLAESGLKTIFEFQRNVINEHKQQHSNHKKHLRPGANLSSLNDVLKDVKL